MRRVVLESPFSGNLITRWLNRHYARQCLMDSLLRGESPIASHLLLTQVLNDDIATERKMGIEAGLAWLGVADASVVYIDRGISNGMKQGIIAAGAAKVPVEYRKLVDGPGVRR